MPTKAPGRGWRQLQIGAKSASEVVFTRNASESLNLVAYTYGFSELKPGDRGGGEHSGAPQQYAPLADGLQEDRRGAALSGMSDGRQLHRGSPGRRHYPQYENRCGDPGCFHVFSGLRPAPWQEIVERAHQAGAVVVRDGAQSVPHMPVNVTKLRVDFLAIFRSQAHGAHGNRRALREGSEAAG